MRITLAQSNPVWESAQDNLQEAEKLLSTAQGDLVVFPEMFTTGFTMNPERVAETMEGRSVTMLKSLSAKYSKAIMGSIVIAENGKYFNRMLFITPNGAHKHYDKRHLFRMGGEDKIYTGGQARQIWEFEGFRILPLVCYDLRFPVWSRNRGDYDMIVIPASWPAPRTYIWRTLLLARAIENQCYVAAVNRTGSDPNNDHSGYSAMIDFKGETMVEAASESCVLETEISLDDLRAFREKFPAWMDADQFTIVGE